MGTTFCLQPWGKWAWNCSASEKILNNFSSAVIKPPAMTIHVTPFFRHSQRGQGSSGPFTSPGLYQARVCRQGCSRVEAWKVSPSPEESEGPVILSNTSKGSAVATSSEERAHHWTTVRCLQQNKKKSWDFGWLELSGSRSLQFVPAGSSVPKHRAHPSFRLALANLHGNRSCQRVCPGVSYCWNLQLSFTAVSLII